jgi:hypothetical protein
MWRNRDMSKRKLVIRDADANVVARGTKIVPPDYTGNDLWYVYDEGQDEAVGIGINDDYTIEIE